MSRGYGYVQRFVLAELDGRASLGDDWVDVRTLAACLAQGAPTDETRRTVRRAIRLLAADGLVELALHPRSGYRVRLASARIDEVAARRARRRRSDELRSLLRVAGPPRSARTRS